MPATRLVMTCITG